MKQQKIFYVCAVFASLIYLFLTFLAPQTANAFNLSPGQILFLKITIALPYLATWIFAAYGLSKLTQYIGEAKPEKTAMMDLFRSYRVGLLWIITGTVLVALIGGVRSYIMNTSILPSLTIVSNYLYVFPSLFGFIAIFRGTLLLQSSPEMSEHKHREYLLITIIISVIASFYIFLIFTNPSRQFSADPTVAATYYLSDLLILLTIVLPIIITWWLGFFVAFTMSDLIPYIIRTEFIQGITRILYGIWSIIFASIIIQALLSLGSTRLYAIGIGFLLLIVYIFVLLQGLGYFLIALGSNELRKSMKK